MPEIKLAMSIPEFCHTHDIGLGTYQNLRKRGRHPREMKVGRRVLISVESAAEWRRERERLTEEMNEREQEHEASQRRSRVTLEDHPASDTL